MELMGLAIFITVISFGLAYFLYRVFLYGWRGFKKKDIIIFGEFIEFDVRVKGFWAQVWAVAVLIFATIVAGVLLMALVWMIWQRE